MRKRNSGYRPILALGTIAATGFILAGCAGSPSADIVYSSVAECVAGGLPSDVCDTGYKDASIAHAANAPKYDALTECEKVHGQGQCMEPRGAGGGFSPFLMGYLMSSGFNNMNAYQSGIANRGGVAPVYRNASGQNLVAMPGGKTSVISAPTNVKTSTVSRGGFGAKAGGSSGG